MSTEKIVKKRGARVTSRQKDFVADFMIGHSEFAAGRFAGPTGAEDARRMWQVVAEEANKLGPQKTVAQWQKMWKDMKCRSRGKVAVIRGDFHRTGNFDNDTEPLTDTDKKVLSVIGSVAVEGLSGVSDSLPESVADLRRLMAGDKAPLMQKPTQCPSVFEAFDIKLPQRPTDTYTIIDTRPMDTHSADTSPTDRYPTRSHSTHTAYTLDDTTNTHPTGSLATHTLLPNTSLTDTQPTRLHPTHTAYTFDYTTNTHPTGSLATHTLLPNTSPTDRHPTRSHSTHTAYTLDDTTNTHPTGSSPTHTLSPNASPTDTQPTRLHPTHTAYTLDYTTNTHPTGSLATHTLLPNTSLTDTQPTCLHPTHTAYTHDHTINTHPTGSSPTHTLSPNASPTDTQPIRPAATHTTATHKRDRHSQQNTWKATKRSASDERAASFIDLQKKQNEILETMSQLLRVATTNEAAKLELKKQGLELKRRKVEAQEKFNDKIAELINVLINK